MSLEQLLAENTAAVKEQTEILKRVLEGQKAALEKIEPPKSTRTKKDPEPATAPATSPEPVAQAPEPAAPEPVAAAAPVQQANAPEVTDADVRAAALEWVKTVDPAGVADPTKIDVEKRQAINEKLFDIMEGLGFDRTSKITGPESPLTAEHRKKAVFFIRRMHAGLPVDFTHAYDLDGDPKQGVGGEAAVVDPLG
jgi:hypothetical protein